MAQRAQRAQGAFGALEGMGPIGAKGPLWGYPKSRLSGSTISPSEQQPVPLSPADRLNAEKLEKGWLVQPYWAHGRPGFWDA